jgi:oligopeptide/dipeptide ABC transporter ATP-binding protein
VMYAGQVVETASVRDLFAAPAHPYTRGLLHSLPKMDHLRERLTSIPGTVPQPWDRPEGCPFHPRCGYAQSICRTSQPAAKPLGHGHEARCHFAGVL